ncbi:MAG: hypothetical protein AB8B85_18435 [Paracoccaceae bacterium]
MLQSLLDARSRCRRLLETLDVSRSEKQQLRQELEGEIRNIDRKLAELSTSTAGPLNASVSRHSDARETSKKHARSR